MGMMKEFKEFAIKGKVMDLAVGVIIGAAFGKIVDSVVKDLIMPVVGAVIGKIDFSSLYIKLAALRPLVYPTRWRPCKRLVSPCLPMAISSPS